MRRGTTATIGLMTVTLRPAAADDEARLLEWRNEPATRASSFDESAIAPDRHHRWFVEKLTDPECAIWIAEEDGSPVGQVRLDGLSLNSAEIHITVAPDARGRGIGRAMLVLATAEAAPRLGVMWLRALVKETNAASLAAFRAAGFDEIGVDGGIVELRRDV
jgi:RimJ/RimL family protein N-acetyltransferase